MYITTNRKWSTLGEPTTPPRLQPRCYSQMITVPNTYDELEEIVRRWISTCVMSRTETRPGVPIRRERELVNGNATLKGIWDRVLQYLKSKTVKIDADYVWGTDREEAIRFSTTATPPPPPPPPPRPVTPPRPSVCPPTTCNPTGRFLPSTHAFKFDNSFSLSIPLPGGLPTISAGYGLCGGMASAALDYFLSCIPIPTTRSVPTSGTTLHKYLFDRLLDSLGYPTFGMVKKFLSWTERPDTNSNLLSTAHKVVGPLPEILLGPLPSGVAHFVKVDGVQELTAREEFPKIVAELSAGRMVVVGLVYVGPGAFNIWENHQVLAYGVDRVSPSVTNIKVYDPNYNGDDRAYLRCELVNGGTRLVCEEVLSRAKNEKVRGFFRMPYTRKTPPCLP